MQELLKTAISHLPHVNTPIAFEPILNDGDELTRAIEDDVHVHDNDWHLEDMPDPNELDAFWEAVLNELGPDETNDDE